MKSAKKKNLQLLYTSVSQPGVQGLQGVHKRFARGTSVQNWMYKDKIELFLCMNQSFGVIFLALWMCFGYLEHEDI